jgi:ribosomal protein L37AE/L43A
MKYGITYYELDERIDGRAIAEWEIAFERASRKYMEQEAKNRKEVLCERCKLKKALTFDLESGAWLCSECLTTVKNESYLRVAAQTFVTQVSERFGITPRDAVQQVILLLKESM